MVYMRYFFLFFLVCAVLTTHLGETVVVPLEFRQ